MSRRLIAFSLLPLLAMACRSDPADEDNDGASVLVDCNDGDASVFPGAQEICDGIDQDCDGEVDDNASDASTFYADVDGDGYGDLQAPVIGCDQPAGTVPDSTDCDDRDVAFHPGAAEEDCTDPLDYNCDGSVGYADADDDSVPACEDCDDAAATVFPGALESCNGVDDDCDTEVDEAGSTGETIFYADADADTYGSPFVTQSACSAPAGYVTDATDCNDASDLAHPGGTEVCDSLDNDCDGRIDDPSATDALTWHADGDGDAHGGTSTVVACVAPSGFVISADDCDDGNAAAYPGASEVCDGADNDCNGQVDEGVQSTWYADGDGDGHGGSSSVPACEVPAGFVSSSDDCDDGNAAAYPGASEVCDGADNDCNGQVDEGVQSTWYADGDSDGHGGSSSVQACEVPAGFVSSSDDCDDGDAAAYPGASEVCDGADNDCNGQVDEGVQSTWYGDGDADGHGNASVHVDSCSAPAGFVATSDDCVDSDASVFPGATEVCNGIDDDCDQLVDDADDVWDTSTGLQSWLDADLDGFGDINNPALTCLLPADHVENADDCDDNNVNANPLATEIWYDGVDQDCSGGSDYDQDGDGHDTVASGGDDTDDLNPNCWQSCGKIVFVTDGQWNGNLGGLAGADAKCQASANAAGLAGTFLAWISNDSGSPATRFSRAGGPYKLVNGTVVANNWADLTDGTLAAPINVTEKGTPPPATTVGCPTSLVAWSNTRADGAQQGGANASCSNWTSTAGGGTWGDTRAATSAWTQWCSGGTCSWTAHLYCVEQ